MILNTLDTGFNPRLHAGGDIRYGALFKQNGVSIHASTQEATSVK